MFGIVIVRRALRNIDTVVHAVALKQVPAAEYNPMEFINTNVLGAQNLIEACLDSNGACGGTDTDRRGTGESLWSYKLCSDKLFIAANQYAGMNDKLRFSVVRYGNVMGSRGSVIPFFSRGPAMECCRLLITV